MKSLQLSIIVILASIASLAVLGCKGKDAKNAGSAPDAVLSVVVDTMKERSFQDWVSFPADLRGSDDAVLTSSTGGRVTWVAEVGTHVKAGDSLCNIEAERYAAVVAQTLAALDLNKNELDRTENNVKAGSLGKAALDKAMLDYDGAKVNVLQAKRVYEDSRCQAPFEGVVVARSLEKFQTVPPSSATVRVARTDRLEAQISLPESDLGAYTKGAKARFSVPGLTKEEFEGSLKTVDLAVDTRTRTGIARLEVVNRHNQLGPGMAGKVLLLRKQYANAIVLATTAILRDEDGAFVMVTDGSTAQKHPIVLGPARSDSVVVLSGIKVGDKVIVQGGFRVTDGTKVKF